MKIFLQRISTSVRCEFVSGSRSPKSGDDRVEFDEFVRYAVNEGVGRRPGIDIHWDSVYDICQPCQVKYDFIGHYETIRTDAERVMRRIAARSNRTVNTDVLFPATDRDSRSPVSHESLRQFYANVSASDVVRLLRLYRKDYETFGYGIPNEIAERIGPLRRNVSDFRIPATGKS